MPKQEIKAPVVRQKGGPFTIETLHLPDPREDEVLVRIEAAGICQTDAHARCRRCWGMKGLGWWSGLVAESRRFLRAIMLCCHTSLAAIVASA